MQRGDWTAMPIFVLYTIVWIFFHPKRSCRLILGIGVHPKIWLSTPCGKQTASQKWNQFPQQWCLQAWSAAGFGRWELACIYPEALLKQHLNSLYVLNTHRLCWPRLSAKASREGPNQTPRQKTKQNFRQPDLKQRSLERESKGCRLHLKWPRCSFNW